MTTLVTFGHRLTSVPDPIIETLRRNEDAHRRGPQSPPRHDFHAGDSLAVTAGPFAGLQGIFQSSCGDARVAILLDVIGRATRVVLPGSSVALA
ncbi:transcription termination/antitermination protein NusG [Thiorhodococcus minor]|uniref:KOW domain-containing protein n=1 Tax=Thiorhodococcus minor TaxID=57489 RepID=A0A6M0K8N2_9GAMM|nr:hypothetical protein [Thiorhodococcus minor]NEV65087.1 hypothetical protein [Thiorhodococcus minor]